MAIRYDQNLDKSVYWSTFYTLPFMGKNVIKIWFKYFCKNVFPEQVYKIRRMSHKYFLFAGK